MIGTEEEARQWWCPMTRVAATMAGRGSVNRGGAGDVSEVNCIASKCAMWRWEPLWTGLHPNAPRAPSVRGYCGLAGKAS